jgi:transcription elongation factor Elf1
MNPIEPCETECPWCGSPLVLQIDCTAGDQRYVEDCAVCCQPFSVRVAISAGGEPSPSLECTRDD